MKDLESLVDDEGENLAVRWFLAYYGSGGNKTVGAMKSHLKNCGYDQLWPSWCDKEDGSHLTKAGAQLWLRHLFSLESKTSTSAKELYAYVASQPLPVILYGLSWQQSPEDVSIVAGFECVPVVVVELPKDLNPDAPHFIVKNLSGATTTYPAEFLYATLTEARAVGLAQLRVDKTKKL